MGTAVEPAGPPAGLDSGYHGGTGQGHARAVTYRSGGLWRPCQRSTYDTIMDTIMILASPANHGAHDSTGTGSPARDSQARSHGSLGIVGNRARHHAKRESGSHHRDRALAPRHNRTNGVPSRPLFRHRGAELHEPSDSLRAPGRTAGGRPGIARDPSPRSRVTPTARTVLDQARPRNGPYPPIRRVRRAPPLPAADSRAGGSHSPRWRRPRPTPRRLRRTRRPVAGGPAPPLPRQPVGADLRPRLGPVVPDGFPRVHGQPDPRTPSTTGAGPTIPSPTACWTTTAAPTSWSASVSRTRSSHR